MRLPLPRPFPFGLLLVFGLTAAMAENVDKCRFQTVLTLPLLKCSHLCSMLVVVTLKGTSPIKLNYTQREWLNISTALVFKCTLDCWRAPWPLERTVSFKCSSELFFQHNPKTPQRNHTRTWAFSSNLISFLLCWKKSIKEYFHPHNTNECHFTLQNASNSIFSCHIFCSIIQNAVYDLCPISR